MKITIIDNDPSTYIISKLNGKKYTRITHTHLKKYNLSIEEYCKKYNLTRKDIVCKKLRDKLSWTKNRAIEMYGNEEGLKRWNNYCNKQAISNTFEYKHKKHGISRSEFDEYNKKRASTKDNFIIRYGKIKGSKKWQDYCELQAYKGSSIQYFIDMYGDEKGKLVWDEICLRKSNTVENFINRYGKIEGMKRFQSYTDNRSIFYSNKSQLLFSEIVTGSKHEYFATKNKEYSVYCESTKKIYFYDFVNTKLKKCIEFNGDCFHANPIMYKEYDTPNPYIKTLTSKDIWKYDNDKIKCIKELRGFEVLIIWESDYDNNPADIVKKCEEFLYGK